MNQIKRKTTVITEKKYRSFFLEGFKNLFDHRNFLDVSAVANGKLDKINSVFKI
jgi:hypothetical protein